MKKTNRLGKWLLVLLAILMGAPRTIQATSNDVDGVERISGTTRVETSLKVSGQAYESSENVVIAGYNGEADALTGTLLASAKNAPLLLVSNQTKDIEAVKAELKRLGASNVFLLGGETAISKKIEEELTDYEIERVSGKDRFDTAIQIATEVGKTYEHIFLTNDGRSGELADALTIGPVAGKDQNPILLTSQGKLPAQTLQALKDLGVKRVTIIGGEVAVSTAVETELKAAGIMIDRIKGGNRWETAEKIAEKYFEDSQEVIVANDGRVSYADALVGGYLGTKQNAPILLTQNNRLPEVTQKYMELKIEKAIILGGERVVSKDTEQAIKDAVAFRVKEDNKLAQELLPLHLDYIYKTETNPRLGLTEWSILALARGGYDIPEEYNELYYSNIITAVTKLMEENDGKLDANNSTEHARLILGLTSVGRDVTDVAGYDIRAGLADFDYVTNQGINGLIYALISLDTVDYEIPNAEATENQTTRDRLIEEILKEEMTSEDGMREGWAFTGKNPDPDITAMTLQALAPYQDRAEVKAATERGLNWLSKVQNAEGGFNAWGTGNSPSVAQVIIALTELGIDPHNDPRFIKNGQSAVDNLLTFAVETGGFMYMKPTGDRPVPPIPMASGQGTSALVAYDRFVNKDNRLYDMSDVEMTTKSLNDVKNEAKLALENYKKASDYTVNAEEFLKAITDGKEAIDQATATGAVTQALTAAKAVLDQIKSDAEIESELPAQEVVYVTVENTTYAKEDGAPWDGALFERYEVEINSETTMMDAVTIALEENEIDAEGMDSNYISVIHDLGEFDGGGGSGWMGTLNKIFPSTGFQDVDVKDQDEIRIMYTTNYGQDLEDFGGWE